VATDGSIAQWLRLAAAPGTVRRALATAAIVGSILVVINHGDALWNGDLAAGRLARILLTVAVPYVVSTVSSVQTRRELGEGFTGPNRK
jgi:short subunit fatty acids transporter